MDVRHSEDTSADDPTTTAPGKGRIERMQAREHQRQLQLAVDEQRTEVSRQKARVEQMAKNAVQAELDDQQLFESPQQADTVGSVAN